MITIRSIRFLPNYLDNSDVYFVDHDHMDAVLSDVGLSCDMPKAHRTSITGNETFTHTRSLEEAIDLARYGWEEGIDRIADLSERIEEQIERRTVRHGMVLHESGGEVDVPAYIAGEINCMWEWLEQHDKQKFLHLTVNISTPGNIDTQSYIIAGAMVVAAVDALERTGRRVEVNVLSGIRGKKGGRLIFGTRVKDVDEHLDLGSVVFAVSHPSYLRRIEFAMLERMPYAWREAYGAQLGGGYGMAMKIPESLHGDVHLELARASSLGGEGAYDWVVAKLGEQGVEVAT